MKISDVISNFDLVSEDSSGISSLRTLFVELAIKGELDHHSSRDESGYPSHWRITPANEVLESRSGNSKLIKGKLHDKPLDGTFPGYSASGQDVWLDHWEHDGTAAILSAVGARCGKAFLAKGKWSAIANTHIIWIPETNFLPEYAMLILNNENFWMRSGTAQPFVKVKATLEKLIAVPPIDEQHLILQKVSDFMQKCDQFENLRDHRNRLLSASRESVINALSTSQTQEEFKIAWERIRSNWDILVGTTESIESLRELILDILFKPKKNDEWGIRSLGDLLTISNGDRSKNYPSKEFRVSAGIPFVNAGHLKDGQIDLSEMDYISRDKYESLSGGKFQDDDILFCLRGSLGKSALVKNFGEGTIASSLAILRVGVELDAEYLFWFLQSGMARFQIKRFDNGTAQPNLAAKSVLKFEIPLPRLSEQKLIVNKVLELMNICDQLQKKLVQKEEVADKFARSVVFVSA